MARDAHFKYSKMVTSHEINVETNTRFIKCYIWPILLYGVEVWTTKNSDARKLEAFEMWIYRPVLQMPWTARFSNDKVLRKMNVNRQLILTIKKRKSSYLGNVLRNNQHRIYNESFNEKS